MAETAFSPLIDKFDDSPTDDELAQLSLQDSQAFTLLYNRYVRRVYNYLHGKVGRTEAEDLTAQVFSEVVASLRRYQPQGNFAAWIFTIARRRAANFLRRRRIWLPLETAETQGNTPPDPLQQVLKNEEMKFLRQRIQELKTEELELLQLHFSAGLTYKEIARVLGKSESAVGVSMHRLLRRLEADWEAENG